VNGALEEKAAKAKARGEASRKRCDALRQEIEERTAEHQALVVKCRALQGERAQMKRQGLPAGAAPAPAVPPPPIEAENS
jgi:hypothetical protein